MIPRVVVTATEVKSIMDNCTVSDTVVNTFIIAGGEVINSLFEFDMTVSDTLLKEIERWFIAHMIASTLHRQTSDEKIGDVTVKYTGKWGGGLDSTSYGQMVKTFDSTGKIAAYTGKPGANITAVKSFSD